MVTKYWWTIIVNSLCLVGSLADLVMESHIWNLKEWYGKCFNLVCAGFFLCCLSFSIGHTFSTQTKTLTTMTGVWQGRWRPWWEERIRATQIWRSRTSIQGTFVSFCFFNLLSRYSICYYSVDFRPDNRAYELKHTGSLHFAFDLTYQWVSPLFKPLFSFFCVSLGWGTSFVFTVCCWFWTLNNLIVCWSINSIQADLNVTFKVLL